MVCVRKRGQRLLEDDRKGVSFLARGATGHPRAQPRGVGAPLQQRRQHRVAEAMPDGRVTKKARDPNQHLLEQQVEFARVGAQKVLIVCKGMNAMDAHPALDAAPQGAGLVGPEIMRAAFTNQFEDAAERFGPIALSVHFGRGCDVATGHDPQDVIRQVGRSCDDIHGRTRNRVPRHRVELRRLRQLHQRQAALAFDCLEPMRTI